MQVKYIIGIAPSKSSQWNDQTGWGECATNIQTRK